MAGGGAPGESVAARRRGEITQQELDDLLAEEASDRDDIFQKAQVCFLGVAGSSAFFAGVLGFVGSLISGPQSTLQAELQALGATLGAYSGISMHKENQEASMERFLKILGGASVASVVAHSAVPIDDLCVLASAIVTAVGAVAVALLTDIDILGQLRVIGQDLAGDGGGPVETSEKMVASSA